MRHLALILCVITGSAYAKDFEKDVLSGQGTIMVTYKSWTRTVRASAAS
jgi:hypothetical protein